MLLRRPETAPTFHLDKIRLIDARQVLLAPGQEWPLHVHRHLECLYVLRGSGHIRVSHSEVHSDQYQLIVYPPGLPHAERVDCGVAEKVAIIGIEVPATYPIGSHLLLRDPLGTLRWLCEQIIGEYSGFGSTRLAEACVQAFLLLLQRAWDAGLPVEHDPVDATVQFIHANYGQAIALRDLAGVACLSERQLRQRFISRLGVSPMRYLQDVRTEAAQRLLTMTELEVKEIAARCGFRDPFYLARIIRRATGCAPSVYRRQARQPASGAADAASQADVAAPAG